MNELLTFNFQGNEVRTVKDEKDNVWWVAKDVCQILGLNDVFRATERVDRDDIHKIRVIDTIGRQQEVTAVNESGLYALVFRSSKPQAKIFKRWITSEVIPSIRKHGAYIEPVKLQEMLRKPDTVIELLSALKEEQERNARLMHTSKTYTVTELAKELGYRNPADLNKKLEADKIQYKRNGTWLPFAKYTEEGYVEHKQNKEGFYYTRWTQKGRDFLLKRYGNATVKQCVKLPMEGVL